MYFCSVYMYIQNDHIYFLSKIYISIHLLMTALLSTVVHTTYSLHPRAAVVLRTTARQSGPPGLGAGGHQKGEVEATALAGSHPALEVGSL